MNPKQPLRVALVVVVCAILVGSAGDSVHARMSGCPSSHGPGTDTLCLGDGLHTAQYISSENGRYRFYYQSDARVVLYDTSTDPWTPVGDIYDFDVNTPTDPSHLMYGVSANCPSNYVDCWGQYYFCGGDECQYAAVATSAATVYAKLTDDGYLYGYDDTDTPVTSWIDYF